MSSIFFWFPINFYNTPLAPGLCTVWHGFCPGGTVRSIATLGSSCAFTNRAQSPRLSRPPSCGGSSKDLRTPNWEQKWIASGKGGNEKVWFKSPCYTFLWVNQGTSTNFLWSFSSSQTVDVTRHVVPSFNITEGFDIFELDRTQDLRMLLMPVFLVLCLYPGHGCITGLSVTQRLVKQ